MLPSLNIIASRLRLKQLRLLISIDELGSIHRAADAMAITQPGATKALQEIESTFGTSLFERTSKGLDANDLGRCVVRYARLIHTDVAHLREEMLGIMQGHGGRLSVGAIMGAVPMLVDGLARLRIKQPELSVSIVEDTSARLLSLLDQGRLDVVICRTSVSRRPSAYDTQSKEHEALVLVANPANPFTRQKHLKLSDIASSRWVVFPVNMPMRLTLEREFREAGLSFPVYPIETSSTFTTLSLLLKDQGLIAVMPDDVARMALEYGMLSQLPLALKSYSEPYEIVTRQGVPVSVPGQLLIDELVRLAT
ncbi:MULTISPECIES: LysR substrate-binding domain-containing protein [unclassified Pseudomonas]|uniref:LysR substrate-binding domain-containing protein n=1 Tax=unclassified Pseudomonas TaxID=196821 RepID=UPI002AC8AE64|nr:MULTISPECIES: LysR substrate-binding domain-containing protein [unclassified Pseudomonas]MEB0041047.1 LysR substrate-binding domain-containing protein [Pseudomonas sp. MH10]MEB0076640.1 LysR substrate-binding domain-containing protein [Pseudomonas sp. MH10out]MEB0090429.1 LysR substrate-binding domain-containing protein [Pseudomonas sp. CCI4.2]MEB0100728.1 LysR substrate-binding domain-containing protein [Pseudomonas sp. CCI3.2]MEB0120833.1 LysR substrate-binding domain-containing protein [